MFTTTIQDIICHTLIYYTTIIPVLSVILPTEVSLPTLTRGLLLASVKFKSKVSTPSTTLSQLTDMLPLPSVDPASIVIVIGLESKSTPDPNRV